MPERERGRARASAEEKETKKSQQMFGVSIISPPADCTQTHTHVAMLAFPVQTKKTRKKTKQEASKGKRKEVAGRGLWPEALGTGHRIFTHLLRLGSYGVQGTCGSQGLKKGKERGKRGGGERERERGRGLKNCTLFFETRSNVELCVCVCVCVCVLFVCLCVVYVFFCTTRDFSELWGSLTPAAAGGWKEVE